MYSSEAMEIVDLYTVGVVASDGVRVMDSDGLLFGSKESALSEAAKREAQSGQHHQQRTRFGVCRVSSLREPWPAGESGYVAGYRVGTPE